jgi:hypothetical protein
MDSTGFAGGSAAGTSTETAAKRFAVKVIAAHEIGDGNACDGGHGHGDAVLFSIVCEQGCAQERQIHGIAANARLDPANRSGLGQEPNAAGELAQSYGAYQCLAVAVMADTDPIGYRARRRQLGNAKAKTQPAKRTGERFGIGSCASASLLALPLPLIG